MSDVCRANAERPGGKVYCQNGGKEKLPSNIRSGISQAASAVHLTVPLRGLAFVLKWW